ncbi:ubiquitin-associated domain-containing protein 1-like isoform X2 [Mercenaria mercenaria]|uniref:ubiquitin-associated domain-containing protein 1-like isoform X2 n=1 Tax=Mercenaria mercenaria TaxID=6596 RepID=UPI00234F1640|nr:ubiquitin-associated domain-containing protein 1-like isoform X2 [Mercenaria mercenaria]
MFVSDTNIFPSSDMKIRVTCPDGTDIILSVCPDSKIDTLKVAALGNLLQDPTGSMKESLYYKVVLVRTCKSLEDDKTLAEQDVQDNDEVLLLKRRLQPSQFEKGADKAKSEEAKRGPNAEEIKKATSSVQRFEKPATSSSVLATAIDFQTELRKILISLIEVSQKLLCLNPEASKIFSQAEEILSEQPQVSKIDEDCVKQLTDMGFQENRAKKALLLNKMSVVSAMEWLLQHENDPDIDDPLPQESSDEEKDDGAVGGQTGLPANASTSVDGQIASPCRVSNILKSLRAYRKREFRPNQKTLQHLMEMGFDESDVIDALRATRNDGEAACELLISNKKPPSEDVDEGIDHDSPLFKAIMANSVVQLGLNNPRCLLAFIQMLEHPHTANQWLSDAETAPLLVQVSRIYHAEKHSQQQQKHEENQRQQKKSR